MTINIKTVSLLYTFYVFQFFLSILPVTRPPTIKPPMRSFFRSSNNYSPAPPSITAVILCLSCLIPHRHCAVQAIKHCTSKIRGKVRSCTFVSPLPPLSSITSSGPDNYYCSPSALVTTTAVSRSHHFDLATTTQLHLFWRRRKGQRNSSSSTKDFINESSISTPEQPKPSQAPIMTTTTESEKSLSSSLSKLQIDLSKISKFAEPNGDVLFQFIEKSQLSSGNPDFGNFLDAGTGSHSLRWIASVIHRKRILKELQTKNDANTHADGEKHVTMQSYTAITADETMRKNVLREAQELGIETNGDVIIGNWANGVERSGSIDPITFDPVKGESTDSNGDSVETTDNNRNNQKRKPLLLQNQTYQTILADYLVGAIDGFSPYFQDLIFPRLFPHLSPGGRLYIIGLQPIPDRVPGDANIMCKITKIRDACILLANHRCYREFPLDWIQRHVKRAGLKVLETRTYPIRYDHATMVRQINVARSKLRLFPSKAMAEEMRKVLDGLEKESLEVTRRVVGGRVTLGFDYVVVAEKPREN
mmetsp:Transcript_6547/g.14222  ORF Transcript_6547/g.14222 Transcript_6547/m.14222 type:complete len:533 (+) Transcript_6547:14-1612(+)